MDDMQGLKKLILQKLVRSNIWGGKHTPFDFVKKGIPEHYRNTHQGKRMLEKVLKEMMRDEWIFLQQKRTGSGYDAHVSLNPKKVADIKQFLEEN